MILIFPQQNKDLLNRQCNGKKKKDKKDLQNITQKAKNLATRTPIKIGDEERAGL